MSVKHSFLCACLHGRTELTDVASCCFWLLILVLPCSSFKIVVVTNLSGSPPSSLYRQLRNLQHVV
jgi:hypothetical protein